MSNVMLTRGGAYRYNLNTLAKQEVYQEELNAPAERVAGEYAHGFFTLGNSFNPLFSIGQSAALKKAKVAVGDFIGLAVVPENHTLMDAAIKVIPVQYERGYPTRPNTDGLVFGYEARIYNAETGAEEGSVDFVIALNGITANEYAFKRSAIKPTDGGFFVESGKVVVLGLKVEALPSNKEISLGEVTGRVEITAHVWDYEAPIHI